MEQVHVREMRPDEAALVRRMGRRAFTGLESLWVSRPRQALVAERDGRVVGAILYKFYRAGGRKIGYVDYAFVDPDCHGQGVGTVLYREAAAFLWAKGCDALTAIVKDDNVGSWGLFLQNGFERVSLAALARRLGPGGAVRQYFETPLCIGVGMELYAAFRGEAPCPPDKGGTTRQLGAYLLANALLALLGGLSRGTEGPAFVAAYVACLLLTAALGFLGTRLSAGRGWRFRHTNGGALVCALVNLGGAYPMVGNWYPRDYEKTAAFRRDMGRAALAEWAGLLLAFVALAAVRPGGPFFQYAAQVCGMFLIYRLMPLYPFESYGGGRVFRWNRWVFAVMAAATAAALLAAFAR